MKNCGKLWKVSNDGVDCILPWFQAIKDTSVAFGINKILQGCVGMVGGSKRIDAVGTSICRGSADDMVLNQTLDVFLPSLVAVGISKVITAFYSN